MAEINTTLSTIIFQLQKDINMKKRKVWHMADTGLKKHTQV